MKLSYRDRVILIVALVILIIGVGIFAFIKPKASQIKTNNTQLTQVKAVWEQYEKAFAEIPDLQTKIKTLHSDAKGWAEYFTEERNTKELDRFMQKYIDDCEMELLPGSEFNVKDAKTEALNFYYYTPKPLTYSLYSFADLDGSLAAAAAETMKESNTLSARKAQEVSSSSVVFTGKVTKENLMKFLKDIKDLDTTVLVTNVSINDYSFYPEVETTGGELTPERRQELQDMVDHSVVAIAINFYSVQAPTDPYLGPTQ